MATVTLRPNGTNFNGWTIVGGSASADAALSDDSDATYVEVASGLVGAQSCAVQLEDLSGLPSGALIKQVRARIRMRTKEASQQTNEFRQDLGEYGSGTYHTWKPTVPTALTTLTGPWHTTKPGGGPWTDAVIDALGYEIADTGSAAKGFEVAEAYVDVEYNEQPTGTLTAPTGTYTTDSSPDAVWSYSDPESDSQTHYRIVVEAGDTSANSAPALDGSEEYDSGEIAGSGTSATLPALTNGTYTVWLRVRQADVSGQAQRSEWDSIVYTLDVAPPAVPTVTATADDVNGRVILTADSASAAGEEAEEYDFQWSDDGTTWTDVRDATGIPPDSGTDDTVATVYDYESVPNTARQYRARAARYDSGSGERLVSAWSSSSVQATAVPTNWWLKDPADPDVNAQIRVTELVESGDRLEVAWVLLDDDDRDNWTILWNQRTTLLLQSQETEQWYVRLVGDRAAVHTPLGRTYPVVVDDGTDPHPQLTRIRGNRAWTVTATGIVQGRP